MQDNMPSCTLLDGFSRELHSANYCWGISIKSPRAYFMDSGAIPRMQLLKSAPCGNLKSTLVAPSLAPAAYCVCKLRWNLAVSGPHVLATMVPGCTWSSCFVRGLKSMVQVHKSTPVAPSSPLRWQPYFGSEIHGPGIQVDSGRTFKLAPAATVLWV
jgi:hypothetical protein